MISPDSSFNVHMTEEQVIHGLSCCGYNTINHGCVQCPFKYIQDEADIAECTSELCKAAYMLITGKQPDISEL